MYKGQKIIVIAPFLPVGAILEQINTMQDSIIDEVLIVDDGSIHRSGEEIKNPLLKIISLGTVTGLGAALRRGYDYALARGFDIIVTLGSSNSNFSKDIPSLLEPVVSQSYDFVQGSRFLQKNNLGAMPIFRRVIAEVQSFLCTILTGRKVTEIASGFRAFRARILYDRRIDLNQQWLNEYELEPYLYYKAVTLGYKTCEVPWEVSGSVQLWKSHREKSRSGWWAVLRPLLMLRFGIRQ